MSRSTRIGRRVRWLGGVLGGLMLLVVARGILQAWPHEPRIYLVHAGGRPDAIRSDCGDLALPRLASKGWVRLDLAPRPGCGSTVAPVTIAGDELIRLIARARAEKADVGIAVGFDSVDITRRYRW